MNGLAGSGGPFQHRENLDSMKPLSKFVLLDLTHFVSGPFGTMVLADLGMRTIKIEPPTGERTRLLLANDPDYSLHGMGAYFLTLNRNKESVCLDLRSEEGLALFYRLVAKADAVIENFSPGVAARLKVDHASLLKHNERIVSCSISGFGQSGPAFDKPAFDLVAQGMGGGMSITGERDTMPMRAGIPIGDIAAGMFAAMGIMAALHDTSSPGTQRHIDISMLDCQVSLLNYMATMHLLSGRNPVQEGNSHFAHVPYNTFATTSRYIIICCIQDAAWTALTEVLGLQDLQQEQYARQPGRLKAKAYLEGRVQEVLATQSCEYWLERLEAARIPCAPVNDFEHALKEPQIVARDMVVDVAHPQGGSVRMPGNPIRIGGGIDDSYASAPGLGADTEAVLSELLGIGSAEIGELKRSGAVA